MQGESRNLFKGLIAAIGSAWTSRKSRRTRAHEVRFVSWAGRADTDNWFRLQLEQGKDRVLYYYVRNQVR